MTGRPALRIGVVCEGPTDFHAIRNFVAAALGSEGIAADIFDIQPEMDKKVAGVNGGWGQVELWLDKNKPDSRVRHYFNGGPFRFDLSAKACDLLLIQMDTDILEDLSFQKRMRRTYKFNVTTPSDPSERGAVIRRVLERWARVDECGDADKRRHIFAPAVESTETWCVAAFKGKRDTERLRGSALTTAFMGALHRSEGKDADGDFQNIDKDVDRRKRFCEKHAAGHKRLRLQCPHFEAVIQSVIDSNSAVIAR